MAKHPRKLSMVRLKRKWASDPSAQELPFINDMPLIFLGEIPNMPDHGVFIGHYSGKVYSGFHIWQFIEIPDEET
jgi:hypothetical protein